MATAVEIAWRRGLVVVAASGNGGPAGGTVGDREGVGEGKRGDLGGGRILKKKKKTDRESSGNPNRHPLVLQRSQPALDAARLARASDSRHPHVVPTHGQHAHYAIHAQLHPAF